MGNLNRPPGRGDFRCGWCGGTGRAKNGIGKCHICGGSGSVVKHPDSRPCGGCRGTGEEAHLEGTRGAVHGRCGGSGWVEPR